MLNATGADDYPTIGSRRTSRALTTVIMVVGLLVGGLTWAQAAAAAPATPAVGAVRAAAAVSPPSATAQPRLTEVAAIAMKATTQRIPYTFGGGHGTAPGNPAKGLDCSGFVRWVYAQVGWKLPAGSGESVRRSGAFVKTSHPVPGDLVFFGSSSAYHVGIYMSPGKFVDSSHPGSFVGLRKIYPGVLGYYHRKDATAFDSQPLRKTVSGAVTVISPTNQRLGGATVTISTGTNCSQRVRTARTDSWGRVWVSMLSGRYCFTVAPPPHGYLAPPTRVVWLTPGKPVRTVIVAPFAPVTFTVHTKAGSVALYGVKVSVYRSDCRSRVVTAVSDSTGTLRVMLTPGRYCLQVQGTPKGFTTSRAMRPFAVPVSGAVSLLTTLTRTS